MADRFCKFQIVTHSNLVGCSTGIGRLCPARPKPDSCAIRSGDTHLVTLSENRSGKGSLIPRLAHTCKTAGTGVGDADGQSTETYHEDAHHRSGLRDRHCRMKIPGFTIEARSIPRTVKVLSDGPLAQSRPTSWLDSGQPGRAHITCHPLRANHHSR